MSSIHSAAFSVIKTLLLFFYVKGMEIKAMGMLELPTQEAVCYDF